MKSQNLLVWKIMLTVALIIFGVAIYFTFGFFFDVFVECIPLLLLPFVCLPFVWNRKRAKKRGAMISAICVLLVVSIIAFTATSVIATSVPAYGEKPKSGRMETYYYSRAFMQENYNINQRTKISVWLPETYNKDNKYPVIYILDGDDLFNYSAIKASESAMDGKGEVIVVGIGYGYLNGTFARGGIIWQDDRNERGRWRDFHFADDTEKGHLGENLGDKYKRGKEFGEFLTETVSRDIKAKYSIDENNATIFGHSMGGSMSAYLLTQYSPLKKENNPFTNFVMVDNAFTDYYGKHLPQFFSKLNENGNKTHSTINVYRIWGGAVNPLANEEQMQLHTKLKEKNIEGLNCYFYIPEGANHSDTMYIGIDNALQLTLGNNFEYDEN